MWSFTIRIVQIDPDALPNDAAELQQMLRAVLQQQSALHAENDKLRLLIQRNRCEQATKFQDCFLAASSRCGIQ